MLLRYCDDGAVEIDNSAAERALHGVAIGRRTVFTAQPTLAAIRRRLISCLLNN